MIDRNCTTNPVTGCVDCPAVPAVPGTPARTEHSVDQGWNAGANLLVDADSDTVFIAGDVHVVFSGPQVGGAVIGFKDRRDSLVDPSMILNGFCLRSQAGQSYYNIIELGQQKTSPERYDVGDKFEIRRVNGNVNYLVNDRVVYRSDSKSFSISLVNACLYMSGDAVN